MKDKKILSRRGIFKSQQTKHEGEVNFIATKRLLSRQKLRRKTQKLMLRHSKGNKAEISMATKEDYVATIKIAE